MKRAGSTSLKAFLEKCQQAGTTPISATHPVYALADKKGIPADFVALAWQEFKRQHLPGGGDDSRRYSDWGRHFQNAVDKRWQRLWYFRAGCCELTSDGKHALLVHQQEAP